MNLGIIPGVFVLFSSAGRQRFALALQHERPIFPFEPPAITFQARESKPLSSTLHIVRKQADGTHEDISLEEWKQAVAGHEGLRLSDGDARQVNPLTNEIITMPNRGGDAEVWREDCQDWIRVFWWSPEGYVSFPEPDEREQEKALSLARSLALRLNAKIYDDAGEETD